MRTIPRPQNLHGLLLFLILSLASAAFAQQRPTVVGNAALEAAVADVKSQPLTKVELISLLKSEPPQRVGEIAHERKIDFQITTETEREIRHGGGDGDLVRILRGLAAEGTGVLFVASDPSGSEVSLDGRIVGITPLTRESVTVGSHRVVVSKHLYRSRELNVVVESKIVTRSTIQLDRLQLVPVTVETDFDYGTLFVDNWSAGPVKPTQRFVLGTGMHSFRLQAPPFGDISQQVDLAGNEEKVLFLKAEHLGNLTVLADVAIEMLDVGGRTVQAPVTVRDIPAGIVRVHGVGPGNQVSKTVKVTPGETAVVRIETGDLIPDSPVAALPEEAPPPDVAPFGRAQWKTNLTQSTLYITSGLPTLPLEFSGRRLGNHVVTLNSQMAGDWRGSARSVQCPGGIEWKLKVEIVGFVGNITCRKGSFWRRETRWGVVALKPR